MSRTIKCKCDRCGVECLTVFILNLVGMPTKDLIFANEQTEGKLFDLCQECLGKLIDFLGSKNTSEVK